MNKFKAQLTALGTVTALAMTSLAVDIKPAQAGGDEFWGAALGGLVGSILGRGNSRARDSYSSRDIKKALKKVMISHGLTPMEECHVNSVSVTLGPEELCAISNHIYQPGTYTVSQTKQLIPYGIGAPQSRQTQQVYPPTHTPQRNQQLPTQRVYQQPNQLNQRNYNRPNLPNQIPTQRIDYSHTNQSFNQGPILSLGGQPISPQVKARLRALLSSKNIAEANCGVATNQVVLTVNNQYMLCGHPTRQYPPGNYSINTGTFY